MFTSDYPKPVYQVGGSLPPQSASYVYRQADLYLFQALRQREFCYVLNARQMGKSSLRVQTALRLQSEGMSCVTIDLTEIGTQHITIDQWYATIAASLVKRFQLRVSLSQWWNAQAHLSQVNRLGEFIETVLLAQVHESIVIFIDEIDSVLSLKFSTDDFFALIRTCFNKRSDNPSYQRLTFCLIGVTTPSDLIADRTRTPFNIGQAIALQGFQWAETSPLLRGLLNFPHPEIILQRILDWTGGQPFLTQKLCNLVQNTYPPDSKVDLLQWIDQLVQTQVLQHWESQDEPEHLRTIRDRLLLREQWAGRLLGLYQRLLQNQGLESDDSLEQTELTLTGLVEKRQGTLQVKNRIYQEIFTLDWVNQQLGRLRPYSETFNAWMNSEQMDESRLLRGQALIDAQQWSQGKHLSDLDYWFLSASEQYDRREVQHALEASRATEIQARFVQERRIVKLQRMLLGSLGGLAAIALAMSGVAFQQYREAKLSEIRALASSSIGLFASDRQLDAMIDAIKAQRQLQTLDRVPAQLVAQVESALRQTVYGNNEFNRLIGHQGAVLSVAISSDSSIVVTGSNDKTVKIWNRDGALLRTLQHSATVHRVAISSDSSTIVTGSLDGTVNVWKTDGTRLKIIQAHQAPVWGIAISPDGRSIASASGDKTVKVWALDGSLKATLRGHSKAVWNAAFSPDGQTIASAGVDQTIKLWTVSGKLLKTLSGHQGAVWDVAFCPQKNLIVSVSSDRTAKVWNSDGNLVRTLQGERPMIGVTCSLNGHYIATSGTDNMVSLWKSDGTFVRHLKRHNAVIRDVALSADGLMLASASDDGTVKLWRQNQYLLKPLHGHQDVIWEVATSPNGKWIATVSGDGTLKLWTSNGTLLQTIQGQDAGFRTVTFSADSRILVTGDMNRTVQVWQLSEPFAIRQIRTFNGHEASVYGVAVSPDGNTIASAGDDRTIRIWTIEGKPIRKFTAHDERIWKLAFNSAGTTIASASEDGSVKLWTTEGKAIATLPGQGAVWGTAISPDGTMIASASRDDTLKLWRPDGRLIKTIPAQSRGLTRVAFSPDGKTIATAGIDNTVKLWSATGALLRTLPGHRGIVVSLAFSADGLHLASGGDDGMVILWDLQKIRSLDPIVYACDWVGDYLQTNVEMEEHRHLCQF
ncbi:AAA-like domain-containing protein [Leptolyngbya sp. AN03gr2]|uniref:AAA-like domain-containing protein n=1 Tax=unclassified Leptolyngbya TaxID=2650499 RepID=UPI003D31EA55